MSCGPKFRRGPRENSGSCTGSGSDSSSSHGSDHSLRKTTGLQKSSASVLSEDAEGSQETPLDQLAKVATAALEADPTDCSERKEVGYCGGTMQSAGKILNALPKEISDASFDGNPLERHTSIRSETTKLGNVIPVLVPGNSADKSLKVVEEQNNELMEEICAPGDREEMPSSDQTLSGCVADRCEVTDAALKGNNTDTFQSLKSTSSIGSLDMATISQGFEMHSESQNLSSSNEACVIPKALCVISHIRGSSAENVKPTTASYTNVDSVESDGQSTGGDSVPTAIRQAHLMDHSTMCRKPLSSEQALRMTKASVSQKQFVQNASPVSSSAECSGNTLQVAYCGSVLPTIQAVIPDHAYYCGKLMPVLKTALAVPDHANYSRNVTAMAQATLPVVTSDQSADEVPVASIYVIPPGTVSCQHQPSLQTSQALILPVSSEVLQKPVSPETPPTSSGPRKQSDIAHCLGESCVHEGISNMLKDELKRMGASHLQRRKKVKVLQQALRRSKQKTLKLERMVAELRKRPKPEDKDELYKKIGKVPVDLWTRQELKAKGEPLPVEYSTELGTFAKTLHSYSAEAYDFVRQTFQGCLPHSRTLMKWKSVARSNDQASTDSVVITNENGEQLVVPLVVVNEAACIEDSVVMQVLNSTADSST